MPRKQKRPKTFIDLTGQVFVRLTVLRWDAFKKGRTMWVCKCVCGKEREVSTTSLRSGNTTGCGCSDAMVPGFKINRLTVIEFSHVNGRGKSHYKYLCECGKITIQNAASVQNGSIKSCGCYRKEMLSLRDKLPEGVAAFNSLYHYYKASAKRRGKEFLLTKEEFYTLTKGICVYCGLSPERKWLGTSRRNSPYIYNGIDRLDNYCGYVKGNIVSCCTTCNRAKNAMSLEEFHKWIERFVDFQNRERDAKSIGRN